MTQIVTCPHCGLKLGLPDDFSGKLVRCSKCKETFTAPSSEPQSPPTEMSRVSQTPPKLPARREREEYDEDRGDRDDDYDPKRVRRRYEDDDDYDIDRYRRRGQVPHRGALILTFGILSFMCCAILGPVAWVMGNNDVREMDAGRMEFDGGLTQAGRIIGIISTVMTVLVMGFYFVIFMFAILAQPR